MSWLDKLLGRDKGREPTPPGAIGTWETDDEHRADKQQADPGALEVEGDPRGGVQDAEYRTADPREIVESEGVAMSGPGGAVVDETSPEERRDQQRP